MKPDTVDRLARLTQMAGACEDPTLSDEDERQEILDQAAEMRQGYASTPTGTPERKAAVG